MKSSLLVRAASLAFGLIGLTFLANGCSAGAEATGSEGSNLDIPVKIDPTIKWYTGTPWGGDNVCDDYYVPVPAALTNLGWNCTYGVEFYWPTDAVSGGYAFACKGGSSLPGTLGEPDDPGPSTPHGPYPGTEKLYATPYPLDDQNQPISCFGEADSGWTLIIDIWYSGGSPAGCHNCPGLH